jgi:hypothetical protein
MQSSQLAPTWTCSGRRPGHAALGLPPQVAQRHQQGSPCQQLRNSYGAPCPFAGRRTESSRGAQKCACETPCRRRRTLRSLQCCSSAWCLRLIVGQGVGAPLPLHFRGGGALIRTKREKGLIDEAGAIWRPIRGPCRPCRPSHGARRASWWAFQPGAGGQKSSAWSRNGVTVA